MSIYKSGDRLWTVELQQTWPVKVCVTEWEVIRMRTDFTHTPTIGEIKVIVAKDRKGKHKYLTEREVFASKEEAMKQITIEEYEQK